MSAPNRRDYDSTIARIASNILPLRVVPNANEAEAVRWAVRVARMIVAETRRTEAKTAVQDEADYIRQMGG